MSMEHESIDVARLTGEVLNKMAEEIVRRVIERHSGYGIEDGIREVIKEEARLIVKTEEFQRKIKDQLIRWLEQ